MLAPDDGHHLQSVHPGKVQFGDEDVELLRLEDRKCARSGVGHAHFGEAGQMLAQHLAIQIEEILILVQKQYFRLSWHDRLKFRLSSAIYYRQICEEAL